MYAMIQHFPAGTTGLSSVLLLVLLCLATHSDLKTRRIPNRLTYPIAIAALVLNLILTLSSHAGLSGAEKLLGGIGVQESLIGGVVVFSGMFFLFLLGCGAGDLKLMTAIGFLLGFRTSVEIWFCSLVVAAVLMSALIVLNQVRVTYSQACDLQTRTGVGPVPKRIPLAPFFSVGTLWVILFPVVNNGERLWSHMYALI